MVGFVDRIASLQAELRSAESEHQREVTGRMISEIDRRIDALVAKLFNIDVSLADMSVEVVARDIEKPREAAKS